MNKTVVACFGMGALGVVIISMTLIIALVYLDLAKGTERMPMDKFTTCIKTVMMESRQNEKPAASKEASDICVNMFMKDR